MKSMFVSHYFLIDVIDYGDILKYNFQGFIEGVTGVFRSVGKKNFIKKKLMLL
jgi:hypothetical protein